MLYSCWVGGWQLLWTQGWDCWTTWYPLRGRSIPARNQDSGNLPLQPTQSPVCHQDLASKCFLSDRGHLSRYSQGVQISNFDVICFTEFFSLILAPMGCCHDSENSASFIASPSRFSWTWWSSRCCCGQAVQRKTSALPAHCSTLGSCLCWR